MSLRGFVHLNNKLKEATQVFANRSDDSNLALLEPGNIIPYLENNLRWHTQAVRSSVLLPV